jgi:type IV secretory pathway VirB2 component (pilin)
MHEPNTPTLSGSDSIKRAVMLGFMATACYLLFTDGAWAQPSSNTPMGDVLCDVVDFVIYGNLGRGLATLAIIMVGVGAMLGKVSWGLAITVAVGISVIFGALGIGDALGIPAVC